MVKGNANGRAQYLTNAIKYWKSRNAPPVHVAYFDVMMANTCDYTLDSDPAAIKVWKTAMTQGLKAFLGARRAGALSSPVIEPSLGYVRRQARPRVVDVLQVHVDLLGLLGYLAAVAGPRDEHVEGRVLLRSV